jgi:predicted DNA-binding transcriptional regulator YafY
MYVPGTTLSEAMKTHLPALRRAITDRRAIDLGYVREDSERSLRRIRPLGLAFFGKSWLVIGWCELRQGFRSFRLDRITSLEISSQVYEPEAGKTLDDYFAAIGIDDPGALD